MKFVSEIPVSKQNKRSLVAHYKSSVAHQRAAAHRLRNTVLENDAINQYV